MRDTNDRPKTSDVKRLPTPVYGHGGDAQQRQEKREGVAHCASLPPASRSCLPSWTNADGPSLCRTSLPARRKSVHSGRKDRLVHKATESGDSYCVPTPVLLRSYWRLLPSYCGPTGVLLASYCGPTGVLLASYCGPTLKDPRKQAENAMLQLRRKNLEPRRRDTHHWPAAGRRLVEHGAGALVGLDRKQPPPVLASRPRLTLEVDRHGLAGLGQHLEPVLADVSLAAAVMARPGFAPGLQHAGDLNGFRSPTELPGEAGAPVLMPAASNVSATGFNGAPMNCSVVIVTIWPAHGACYRHCWRF